jgi:hypothetical protein
MSNENQETYVSTSTTAHGLPANDEHEAKAAEPSPEEVLYCTGCHTVVPAPGLTGPERVLMGKCEACWAVEMAASDAERGWDLYGIRWIIDPRGVIADSDTVAYPVDLRIHAVRGGFEWVVVDWDRIVEAYDFGLGALPDEVILESGKERTLWQVMEKLRDFLRACMSGEEP